MRVFGTLDDKVVYYDDSGYNQSVWFYVDTKERKRSRFIEFRIAMQDDVNESFGSYEERTKSAWRQAYMAIPVERVAFGDVPRIVTPNADFGDKCLADAVARSSNRYA